MKVKKMTKEQHEAMTISNAKDISSLITIARTTSADVDKLVTHMDRVVTITAQLKALHMRVDKVEDNIKWLARTGVLTLISVIGYFIVELFK